MTVNVNHDDFAVTIADVRAAATRIDERRRHVCREVDALLDGGWRGAAADSFRAGWEEWDRAARRVLGELVDLGTALDAVHRDLTDRDVQSRACLDGIAARVAERLG